MLINELIDGCSETVDTLDRDVNECKQEILRSLNQEQATEIVTRCEELKVKEMRKLTYRKNKKLAQLRRQTKPSKQLYEICDLKLSVCLVRTLFYAVIPKRNLVKNLAVMVCY